ncbi:lipolysis-stimulated lipoprotein receptor-like isoform X1 [Acipenser ruthenus]|uniref:lipolysis-stimulated lipoprotein receptor-like isoform X1 n=1 Tax=Acipenser ruthenus TaxID=7906 RepID=UPI002740F8C7|nr:lipolysis-stimulated lipoprotein receptor-like isoform X1 [Acipenser ruthenus]
MILRVLLLMPLLIGSSLGISVTCPQKKYVTILFQPVVLRCNYQTTATQPPTITWRYKSFCQDPVSAALNPNSVTNQIANSNPNYNPNTECADSGRTIRIVASKQGSSVTLGEMYQGRRITITGDADLSLDQTAWGDGGVYYCSVVSAQDLTGNSEDFTELIVLGRMSNSTDLLPGIEIVGVEDWLLVVLVIMGFLLLLMLIGICWCQCCPHTCCCYVSCPCCPERCCCPRALYEAGKAVTSGVPSMYAPSVYAASNYSHPGQAHMVPVGSAYPMVPIVPSRNGYMPDYDGASSVGHHSQVPLLHDQDGANSVRSGYRIQANQVDDSMRVLYYMEKELANFDPTRPGDANGKYEKLTGMSEVSSLHEPADPRANMRDGMGRVRNQAMMPIMDVDENMSVVSSVSRHADPRYRDDASSRGGRGRDYIPSRGRARSMDDLDDLDRSYRDDHYRGGPDRGGRGNSGVDRDDRWRRDYSPDDRRRGDPYERRSRSRDDLRDLERRGSPPPRGGYDDGFLEEALRRKQLQNQPRSGSRDNLDSASDATYRSGGNRRDRRRNSDDGFPTPPPPLYTDTESLASSKGRGKGNLRKNGAVSRESLVV